MSKESLSALLDGECRDDELDRLLAQMDDAPELARTWSRMCLGREMRDGTQVRDPSRCIVAGVMSGIAEPHAAPAAGKVVALDAVRQRMRRVAWKPLFGMAAAASMGAAAVLVLQPAADGGATPMTPVSNVAVSTMPASLAAGGAQRAQPASAPAVAVAADARSLEQMQMLREYLINHSDSVSGHGVGGALYYTRFAAHTGQTPAQAEVRR